jgi:uncharacterized protein (TIGR02118 family)
MVRLMIYLARKPEITPSEWEDHMRNVHLPLARKLPGIKGLRLCKVLTGPDGLAPQWDFVAEEDFDSVEAIGTALGSPEGQAVKEDAGAILDVGKLQFLVLEEQQA